MDGVAAIGFQLSPKKITDFYILTTYNDSDEILIYNGKILAFKSFEKCEKVFNFFDEEIKSHFHSPRSEALTCNIFEAKKLIKTEKTDINSFILNCLNTFFDAFRSMNLDLPKEFKSMLIDFANFLTFNNRVDVFFSNSRVSRTQILAGFDWCFESFVSSIEYIE